MCKSLGDKLREVRFEKASEIVEQLRGFAESAASKLFATAHFGFRKMTVERPLRLAFQANAERVARLEDERAFANLARSPCQKTARRARYRSLAGSGAHCQPHPARVQVPRCTPTGARHAPALQCGTHLAYRRPLKSGGARWMSTTWIVGRARSRSNGPGGGRGEQSGWFFSGSSGPLVS